ncbi:MAG: glycoside hydrolase family 15 protein [Acidimicrobiia bacterium]|jgi:glucoamylase
MTTDAPGAPGIEPRWTSSAKEAVGTALGAGSPVWFTLSHGILNEVYYPRIDTACLRDAEFLVSTPDGRFFEEKRHGTHHTGAIETAVPAYRVETGDSRGEFTITKRYATDPDRPSLLIDVTFTSADEPLGNYTLVFLAAPHLANHGQGNTAWTDEYKGTPVVYASRDDSVMAVATTAPVLARSVGYVGASDAWQDLHTHNIMEWQWDRAENGNVAVAVRPDLAACEGRFTIALGFGATPAEAGQRAVASLRDGFDAALARYRAAWRAWSERIRLPDSHDPVARASALVLATHEAKAFPGGLIASLSVPWGFAKGDGDLGGYHLVWPRDHVEAAGALFAIGAHADGLRALSYLRATQEADGHWAQNLWLDGTPYWGGVQMDETALPVLLVDLARSVGALGAAAAQDHYWPMVRSAARYLVCNGPVTSQDRWEEDGGYSPFTLATEIAALLVAAEMADDAGEPKVATYLRDTADTWNAHIETWCYASGTELATTFGIDGYYVRIGAPDVPDPDASDPDGAGVASPTDGWVPIKNRPPGEDAAPARTVVSPDALALVRFGLRAPDDPRILATLRVIDATLKEGFPFGPGWRRYTDDGYGEHPDGNPFDGAGQGRIWPLLTGERAHVAIAAKHLDEARSLAATMQAMAGNGGLLPEQTWDAADLPERELFYGRPAGSAMPLVWAHAEYLKLLRSIADGAVFDLPAAVQRHLPSAAARQRRFWRRNHKIQRIPAGATLRIELTAPAFVHWSPDGWATTHETATSPTGIGMHIADLATGDLPEGTKLLFTVAWREPGSAASEGYDRQQHKIMIGRSPQ